MEEIIIKYLLDDISQEELEVLEKWIAVPENKKEFEKIIKVNQGLTESYLPLNSENAYNLIIEKTHLKNTVKVVKLNSYKKIIQYAAIIILLVSISVGTYSIFNKKETEYFPLNEVVLKLEDGTIHILNDTLRAEIFDEKEKLAGVIEDGILSLKSENKKELPIYKLSELKVPYGKHIKVKMPDGTLVSINSGSTFEFYRSFLKKRTREVILDGEAYFEVTKDKNKPFIVHTNAIDIKVLGTKFNVSNYKNENTSVILEEGGVTVKKYDEEFVSSNSVTLKPGEEVIVVEGKFKKQIANVEKKIAWVNEQLYFKNDRFEDIIKKLERYYDIEITNNSKDLNDVRYTGVFKTKTVFEILNIFKETSNFNFEYLKKEHKIIITPY